MFALKAKTKQKNGIKGNMYMGKVPTLRNCPSHVKANQLARKYS